MKLYFIVLLCFVVSQSIYLIYLVSIHGSQMISPHKHVTYPVKNMQTDRDASERGLMMRQLYPTVQIAAEMDWQKSTKFMVS